VLVRRHQLIALGVRGHVRRPSGLADSAILAAEILAVSLVVLAVALAIRLLTP
jgi:hypothetical protein